VLGIEERRLPHAVLTVGLVAAVVYLFSPTDSALQVATWFVPIVLAVVLHVRRYRLSAAPLRGPLRWLVAGAVGYLGASAVWYLLPTVFDTPLPFPSLLDVAYFSVYGLFAVFLLKVIRRQRSVDPVDARLAVVDALILTVAMSTLTWEAVIEVNLAVGAGGLATATAVAYPAFTILLFGLGVRLAVTSHTLRSGAGALLLAWVGAEVAADVVYGHQSASGTFDYGTSLSLLWMIALTCLAALAVHPGMDDLLEGAAEGRETSASHGSRILGWGRLLLLYLAALGPVALLAGHEEHLTTLLASAVSFGLVIARLAIVAGDQREQRRLADELERANAAKSDFLATMSHEIRTPLNAVIGMTGLLLDSPLDAEQKEYAETTRVAAESLLSIISDILDFSKIEADRLELESQPFYVVECVESAVDLLSPQAAAKTIQLAYLVDRDCPVVVTGDVTRLRQILVNLLSNAVKFTDDGEVLLRVRRHPDDQDLLCFSVTDSGLGIPAERVDTLFDPFSQVDTSITRTHGGTGLGLAISARLTEAMDGTIRVESELGTGSTFHVTARLPEATDVPTRNLLAVQEMHGKHLLVVDDNLTNRQIIRYQLETWHMTAADTGDPAEAMAWMRQGQRFDAAILDLHMPVTDGVELAEALRREGDGGMPLILLSSLGERDRRPAAAEFSVMLTKPIKPSALYDALVTSIASHRSSSPAEAPAPGQVGPPLRILVAEDNAINQKVAERVLERLGYRVDMVANGVEAVEAVTGRPYDVVLMDVQMPEMDGLEATRVIRSLPAATTQPHIIAMTANAFAEDKARCLEAGMDDYLSKPVRSEDLSAALLRAAAAGAGSRD
jgi:signal transduction histidine kinase/CheY-like chemotaxis protein